MSVLRQLNLLSQMRLDVPHLRSLESSIAADFDVLAGRVMTGSKPQVVRGFTLSNIVPGTPATGIQMVVADAILMNIAASESGTFFWAPNTRAPELLDAALNPKVRGGFTAAQVNYIGLDLLRSADSTTADLVQFLDADTLIESPKTVPLGRTLDYRIVISTMPFSAQPNLVPIAKVVTNANNQISTSGSDVTDCRPMMFRLGSGGDFPDRYNQWGWAQGRNDYNLVNGTLIDKFQGGDKYIRSQKEWMDAVMTRLWEIGGGEQWYAPTADRNVRMTRTSAPYVFSNGDNFEALPASGSPVFLHWMGLGLMFENSNTPGVYFNTIADQVTSVIGVNDLQPGDCIYVDMDRTSNATLTARKGTIQTLGTPLVPGSRIVLAWCIAGIGSNPVLTRDTPYPVNSTGGFPATTTALGIVKLSRIPNTPAFPIVISDAGGTISPLITGTPGLIIAANVGGGTATGLTVTGNGSASGISTTGGATGAGITATGGSTGGAGVIAQGTGSGNGITASAGTTGGTGGTFNGGPSGVGVNSTGGSGAAGGNFSGGSGNASGVTSLASGLGAGGVFRGTGVSAPSTNGEGIIAIGASGSPGARITGTNANAAVIVATGAGFGATISSASTGLSVISSGGEGATINSGTDSDGVIIIANGTGRGLVVTSGNNAIGAVITAGGGSNAGATITGSGAGAGVIVSAPGTGVGATITAAGGTGLQVTAGGAGTGAIISGGTGTGPGATITAGSGGSGVGATISGAGGGTGLQVNAGATGVGLIVSPGTLDGIQTSATGTSRLGIDSVASGAGGIGVRGRSTGTTGYGVVGTTQGSAFAGVLGQSVGTGAAGVVGLGLSASFSSIPLGVGVYGVGASSGQYGVMGEGGATDSGGVQGISKGTGIGVRGHANGSGYGVEATSAFGRGLFAQGGTNDDAIFTTTVGGGLALNATTVGSAAQAAIATGGYIVFTSPSNPASTVSFNNTLTAKNIVKAWAWIDLNSGGNPTLRNGFNVASVALLAANSTQQVRVTFAGALGVAFPGAATASGFGASNVDFQVNIANLTTTAVDLSIRNPNGTQIAANGINATVLVIVMGEQ